MLSLKGKSFDALRIHLDRLMENNESSGKYAHEAFKDDKQNIKLNYENVDKKR